MSVFRQVLKSCLTNLLPKRYWLARGPRRDGEIALTFDDGPHPEWTPRLLDVLEEHNVRATFFVVGAAAEKSPALIRRIVAAGHTLGHHTYSHGEPALTSAAQMLAEVSRTRKLLHDLCGVTSNWFRPPKGKLTVSKIVGLWKADQTIVLWNRDPKDYLAETSSGIQHWAESYQPGGGDIVLLHDTHPHALRCLGNLVQRCRREYNTRFVRISDWYQTTNRPVSGDQGIFVSTDCDTIKAGCTVSVPTGLVSAEYCGMKS